MSDIRTGLRGQLLAQRGELSFALEGLRREAKSFHGRVAEDDQAQAGNEEFITVRRNAMSYQTLRLVNEALDRMDSGDYGVCQACEEPISPRRLHAIPWAKYCVPCQERTSLMGEEFAGSSRIEPFPEEAFV